MYNPFTLEGKNILVTGASSGIGRSICIECSKAGANIILTGRNHERLQQTLSLMESGNHRVIVADLTIAEDIQKLADLDIVLDGVALVAGINDKLIIKKLNESYVAKMLATNFSGPVLLIQALLKRKCINRCASIIFMSSVSAFYPSVSNAIYAATKAAVNQFAKVLSLELIPLKARVNCIEPAFVETEMIKKYDEEALTEILHNYPLGRFAKPEEIAYAVIYYLSDASLLVTGTSLIIDGGYTLQ